MMIAAKPDIFVNQTGYLPAEEKKAVLNFPAEFFSIADGSGEIFYQNRVSHFGADSQSGDDVYIADFTEFSRQGTYRVCAGGKYSSQFRIADVVYDGLFRDAARAFYFLRCGFRLDKEYAGVYSHDECHTGASVIYGTEKTVNITGGWHDAGDYGKYVTAGSVSAAHLLYAYKLFPQAFSRSMDIPESGSGIPDILSEIRVELEWLMKMQREDGAAYHKQTTMQFAPFIMPEHDSEQLYVFPPSSFATADLCAVTALGARIYNSIEKDFSDRLRRCALKAFDWLTDNPGFVGFSNPKGCETGLYGESSDTDNRFWAFCELYALTQEEKYHKLVKEFYKKDFPKTSLGYSSTGGLGCLAYMTCDVRDETLSERMRDEFNGSAYYYRELSDKNGYGAAMADYDYYWGSNMTLLQHAMTFLIADTLNSSSRFRNYAAVQLDVLLGKNPLGISYVTGQGSYHCNFPHYRPASADGVEKCVPGFVCGGPNPKLEDYKAKQLIPAGTPPMKCFADDEQCYSLNEVTIYWNSPLVFVLAGLIPPDSGESFRQQR